MKGSTHHSWCFCTLLILATTAASVRGEEPAEGAGQTEVEAAAFLQSLVGSWEGTCRTWFRPGELADESKVTGEFQSTSKCVIHHGGTTRTGPVPATA